MYSQLDSSRKVIRVLKLLPGNWRDDIECHLSDVSLLDQPCYKALSYVWGEVQHAKPVNVNNQPVTVTQNLYEALQRIREEESMVTIWIDALSINQADLDERCEQVQLMKDIYTSAEEVLIWLGYGGYRRAPETKPRMYHFAGDEMDMTIVDEYFQNNDTREESDDERSSIGAFVYLYLSAVNLHMHEMPFFTVDGGEVQVQQNWVQAMQALDMISGVPWWTRIWVLQEVVLANEATMIYGSIAAPWKVSARAVTNRLIHDQFCCHVFVDSYLRETLPSLSRFSGVQSEIGYLRALRAERVPLSLLQIMSMAQGRKAKDPRDQLYGMIGLVTDWYGEKPLLPNYRLSFRDIIMETTVARLQGTRNLNGLMGYSSDTPGLPSWIKQASNSNDWKIKQFDRISQKHLCRAAGPTMAKVEQTGDTLIVDAFEEIDTVASVGAAMSQEPVSWPHIVEVIKEWRSMINVHEDDRYMGAGQQSYQEAFWRTLLNDCIMGPEKTENQGQNASVVRTNFRRLEYSDIAGVSEDWWYWAQYISPGSKNMHDETGISERALDRTKIRMINESFMMATALQTFFVTKAGHMGIGPAYICPGDAIILMLGGSTPFCIRSNSADSGQNATLVGDVYVHGLMDGEGVTENWQEKIIQISLT
ncbi:hypothetical protein HBH56_145730 [Parastagonospora nodorum]|uniref:Heterokaryon incompatibility domain-containing protein n=2 Tax=Phaeosphaeria nodorum (strain SN15 / ATCC MYA-4574 / FGSC 10173) TaxID=321614 RepID=Q0U8C1_PHANO|nr:hypothetical protein SNOG_11993 [Parastagonospora nodorum SN15]KAH3910752.1 hypothetical protein HBH56_145730 [Parastagonospora nodorum]EAT80405.1 hypothetical protein SNOG_11993 [Parastagonospora nodorum SN15]KAH3927646.1 hypothetical protein HBH54_150920 [Parastagonospora nodorum]KAH3947942.1 hypothetical protein HBH53_110940 [Parastagonospora nodorum]KAH3960094.1 hypothetical protein HBH51_194780 [Parastagonospora nodorum]